MRRKHSGDEDAIQVSSKRKSALYGAGLTRRSTR